MTSVGFWERTPSAVTKRPTPTMGREAAASGYTVVTSIPTIDSPRSNAKRISVMSPLSETIRLASVILDTAWSVPLIVTAGDPEMLGEVDAVEDPPQAASAMVSAPRIRRRGIRPAPTS